jgi:hypothetical protein
VSEGVFLPESGAFLPLPKLPVEPFLKLWEQEVFALETYRPAYQTGYEGYTLQPTGRGWAGPSPSSG